MSKDVAENFGQGDATYQAVGALEGIKELVEAFYTFMDVLPEAVQLRSMHSENLEESKQKLCFFLSGWMGGPRLYAEHFGKINIPGAHRHLGATKKDAEAWMFCMQKALDEQAYSKTLKQYLYDQLSVPARRIVEAGSREQMSR